MIESIIIFVLFAGAVYYLFTLLKKSFQTKKDTGCAKGCGTCSLPSVEVNDQTASSTNFRR